jgi:hypothetical protein
MDLHGTEYLGKVDEVKGLFYVATRFYHWNLVPLSFSDSFLLFAEKNADGSQPGIPIPRSYKSVLVAYLRGILGLLVVLPLFITAVELVSNRPPPTGFAIPVVPAGALLWLSYRFCRASPLRALYLARLAVVLYEEVAARFVSAQEIPAFLATHLPSLPDMDNDNGK